MDLSSKKSSACRNSGRTPQVKVSDAALGNLSVIAIPETTPEGVGNSIEEELRSRYGDEILTAEMQKKLKQIEKSASKANQAISVWSNALNDFNQMADKKWEFYPEYETWH